MSPTIDTTPHGLGKIDTAYSITNNFEEVKKELEKHSEALEIASKTALKQGERLKELRMKESEDRNKIIAIIDGIHGVEKSVTERFAETDSRVEQLEKENKILKYAVGASAVFDFALLFIFMIVTSGY